MNWDEYYIGFALHAAKKSKDSTKVGAILVDPSGAIILTAFNGPPHGVKDLPERFVNPLKQKFAAHAEQNLISFAARLGIRTNGCLVYCTHMPCCSCAKQLIQAGVAAVYYGNGTYTSLAEDREFTEAMFKEAGVLYDLLV